jgi:hypothetical protein
MDCDVMMKSLKVLYVTLKQFMGDLQEREPRPVVNNRETQSDVNHAVEEKKRKR